MENIKEMSLWKVIKKLIVIYFRYTPILAITITIIGALHGASFALNTIATQGFFDSISEAVRGSCTGRRAIIMAVILGCVIIINQILNGVHNYMWGVWSRKISGYLLSDINNKAGKLDPIVFENTELLDTINKAKRGVDGSFGLMSTFVAVLSFYLPYFIFMTCYLFRLDKILVLAIVVVFFPVTINQILKVKIFTELEDEVAPIRRQYEYYEKAICDREYFKETRIIGGFNYFREVYEGTIDILGKKIWRAEKKIGLLELAMKLLTLSGYLGVLCLLFRSLLKGNITIGAFSAVFASIDRMISLMNEMILSNIGRMTRELGTVRNLLSFFNLPERKGEDIEISAADGIKFNNVSFCYPESKFKSIKNINLEIKSKEIIAIVGENGAGKSTLVRLMTGIYLPTEGEVLYGDIDTRKVSSKALYKNITGVFQKYQRYKMDLKDNVIISNTKVKSYELLNLSIEKADLNIESENFTQGYETMLSREFDGVDLSGGQWQRVAIARGFYKVHDMIVLDEPTAAIDPVEETKLYERFADISKDKTAIIVTHRLGSAKIAQRIIVMDNGQVAEIGTHEELIATRGKYAEMYEAQSRWYVREEDEEVS